MEQKLGDGRGLVPVTTLYICGLSDTGATRTIVMSATHVVQVDMNGAIKISNTIGCGGIGSKCAHLATESMTMPVSERNAIAIDVRMGTP